jgi:hypothetical protein
LSDTRVLDAIEEALSGCDGTMLRELVVGVKLVTGNPGILVDILTNPLLGIVATGHDVEFDALHAAL